MGYQYDIALSFATENEELVNKVYHYLKAENINVFFAPSKEGQVYLSGKNQREAFYNMFGLSAEYVALFVSADYVAKTVPMEEANIALFKHGNDGKVIPIYLDGTQLPEDMFDPDNTNYFKSNNPVIIASHLAEKIHAAKRVNRTRTESQNGHTVMNVHGNTAGNQIIIQNWKDA